MPRNGSGTFTLVTGNPVVSGTIIESTWANSTLADIADSITNSLARNGEGGMTAALRVVDGTVSVPGLAFANETGSGLYRAAAGDVGLAVLGSRILRLQASGATVTGTLTTDNLVVNDNSTLGASNTDTLAVNARITTDLEPNENNAKDVGTSGRNWRDGFFGRSVTIGGTSAAGFKLNVVGTASIGGDLDVAGAVFRKQASGTGYLIYGSNGATNNGVYYDQANSAVSLWTVSNQRLTVDSFGNVGIGTSSPGAKLHVSNSTTAVTEMRAGNSVSYASLLVDGTGASQLFAPGGTQIFNVNGAERMRINSSGNLLVGTTSDLGKITVTQSSGFVPVIAAAHSGNTDSVRGIAVTTPNYSGADGYFYLANAGGSDKFYVRTSGNVQNTNNSYGAISDVKLKENIVDATPKLEKLNQVRVVNYNLIGDEQKQLGVIAQELEQVFPGLVEESTDRDADGKDLGTITKSVKYSVFVPMLIKAIQELKAEFDAYKAAH